MVKIGVLGLQGAFQEHVQILQEQLTDVDVEIIKLPEQLQHIQGLILPGGESTAIAKVAERWNLLEPLREWVRRGKPIWGTCAGMILLANTIENSKQGGQELIGGIEIQVARNYFGSQISSFQMMIEGPPGYQESAYTAIFIRAPIITAASDKVTILSTIQRDVDAQPISVAARMNNILVTAFHPELTQDARWHEYFVRDIVQGKSSLLR